MDVTLIAAQREVAILFALEEIGPATVSELSEELGLPTVAINRTLSALLEADVVERDRRLNKRNTFYIYKLIEEGA